MLGVRNAAVNKIYIDTDFSGFFLLVPEAAYCRG
jgi:hypothetical protein